MVKYLPKVPPRKFNVGLDASIIISDFGSLEMLPDEQVTFVSNEGKEYDVAAKSWGCAPTPSVNKRLKSFGYKTALVSNASGDIYVMIVDEKKIEDFSKYCEREKQIVLEWLSDR